MTTENNKPPATRLVTRAQTPALRVSADERMRRVRNQLRKYSAVSVVDSVLARVAQRGGVVEQLQRRPWLDMLLAKMALQDSQVYLSIGPPIPWQVLDQLNNELWDLTSHDSAGNAEQNIFATVRALWHAQAGFQRKHSWGFMRWPALIANLQAEHPNRRQFAQVIGMEPSTFIDLAFALYSMVIADKGPIAPNWFDSLRKAYGPAIDRLHELFVRDIHELRTELSAPEARRLLGRGEVFEFPYLKRFPLLRSANGQIICWHPYVFARGIEEAIHLRLTALGEKYTRPFSHVFESYVTELLSDANLEFIDEQEIKRQAGNDAPAVEAIVEADGANVFVEAKMSLFSEEVMVEDDVDKLLFKTHRVRDAVKQGWKVGRLLRSGAVSLGTTAQASEDFLLVVTSSDLHIGTGTHLQRILPKGKLEAPDDDAARVLPLKNVFVVSIEEFERLCAGLATRTIALVPFLRDAVRDNEDAHKGKWFLDQHLTGKAAPTASALVAAARAQAETRLTAALGVEPRNRVEPSSQDR